MSFSESSENLVETARRARINVLTMLHSAKASHLGSSMSIIELLVASYSILDIAKIKSNSRFRDRVIVSKGHAAAATYSVMHEFGLIDDNALKTYHQKDSFLQGHVSHGVSGVEHSTGALGHGLSVGVGHAYFLKSNRSESKVIVICGDGEVQEGSIWEALMLASTKKLGNLILLVDVNEISSIKATEEIINTGDLADRFRGFGLKVSWVEGHDISALAAAMKDTNIDASPLVLLCKTTKGKGVDFAENQPIWHYRSLDSESFSSAMEALK
jgi:transketolase